MEKIPKIITVLQKSTNYYTSNSKYRTNRNTLKKVIKLAPDLQLTKSSTQAELNNSKHVFKQSRTNSPGRLVREIPVALLLKTDKQGVLSMVPRT